MSTAKGNTRPIDVRINPYDLDCNPLVPGIIGPVAVDTETSGLFVDDGARMATTSVAWIDYGSVWREQFGYGQHTWGGGIFTIREELVYQPRPGFAGTLPVVSLAWPFDQGVSGTDKAEDDGQATLWPEAENQPKEQFDALLRWLGRIGSENGLVMHNAKFDVHILAAGVRRWRGIGADLLDKVVWDTQNGNALLYSDGTVTMQTTVDGERVTVATTSLKPTAKALWGDGEGDEQKVIQGYLRAKKLPSGRWDLMPWDIIARYADDDARKTIRLYHRQLHDIATLSNPDTKPKAWTDLRASMDRRMAVTRMLTRIERRALPFDAEAALIVSEQLDKRAQELENALPFAPATLNTAKHYWFGPEGEEKKGVVALGIEPFGHTKKGEPQLTASIIDQMVDLGIEGAREWRSLQKVNTANSRWYQGYASMVGPDGRLRAGFRQNGTVSGRFSIERVQLQAIPHDYKLGGFPELEGLPTPRALIGEGVPEGYVLWEADLQNAEARVAAEMARCHTMLRMIRDGIDLHGATAKELFGVDEKSVEWDQYRGVGKRANFSLVFGVGPETFQQALRTQLGIDMSLPQVTKIVRDWNRLYPEYATAIKEHSTKVEARQRRSKNGVGWISMLNGERRWFQKGEETHKAFNQRVQGNLAQFGVDWWLKVEAEGMVRFGDEPWTDARGRYVGRLGAVMLIHDSVVAMTPDDESGVAYMKYIQQTGAEQWKHWFKATPGGVDVKRWGTPG